MLGAAISAGASLISGLLGRSSAKKQAKREEDAIRKANDIATANAQQMNKELRARADAAALVPVATSREHSERSASMSAGGVDMGAFMSAAENYGFNPLTFLRSGALSLFATQTSATATDTMDWTCTTGERAMDAAMQGNYLPQLQPVIAQTKVPGIGDVLGNALQSGANQYLGDLSQQQNNDFQMQMLNAKLGGANQRASGSAPLARSFYQPQAFLNGSVYTGTAKPPEGPIPLWEWAIDNAAQRDPFGNYPVVRIPNRNLSDSEQLGVAIGAGGVSAFSKRLAAIEAWMRGSSGPDPQTTPAGGWGVGGTGG